ncbi:MAG: UDP-3-O-(3-hydroxymyristoyl)glucosamine N-acyltransferase [Acidaminococcaceae bacterium]
MKKTLRELATLLQGQLDSSTPEMLIDGVNGLEEATATEISFAVPPYIEASQASRAGALVLPVDAQYQGKAVIRVANPRAAFAQLLDIFRHPEEVERVISPQAVIDPTAVLGKDVAILPFAVIAAGAVIGDNTVIYPHVYIGKNVHLGADCVIYPSVTIRENCLVGDRVILQAGAVIGGDGFGYITTAGKHSKVLQAGNVVLKDDVEIGNNTCIDRATAGSTVIGAGTKIDNLVHLGHNDVLGDNCLVVAQVGLSGSTVVGNNVTLAGQTGSVGHIQIGDNCVFAARSGITNNVEANSFCAGFPAVPHREWLKQEVSLRKVGDLIKKVKELEKALAQLQK